MKPSDCTCHTSCSADGLALPRARPDKHALLQRCQQGVRRRVCDRAPSALAHAATATFQPTLHQLPEVDVAAYVVSRVFGHHQLVHVHAVRPVMEVELILAAPREAVQELHSFARGPDSSVGEIVGISIGQVGRVAATAPKSKNRRGSAVSDTSESRCRCDWLAQEA